MSWTSVHGFFPDLSRAYNMVQVIRVKLYGNDLKGKHRLAAGSSYQGFELLRVKLQ